MPQTTLPRRRWMMSALPGMLFGMLLGLSGATTQAAEVLQSPGTADTLPFMENLSDIPRDLAAMQERKIPMLLFVHASYCSYCQRVDSSFIQPMLDDPAYQGKLIIRRIEIDAPLSIRDRHGIEETNMHFAQRLDVRLVPVVAFFGPDGKAIGDPIKGVTVPDFYPYYLGEGIKLAEQCAKTPDPARCMPSKVADQRSL
ncbi:MAG: thioredoxin family protein [Halothiobacillus sp.]